MGLLENITGNLIRKSCEILGDHLIGIYLHGSAVMGCFNEKKSDIDFIVVVDAPLSDEMKHSYMDMAVELNSNAPEKGIEFSIVREDVCNPFVYPTPFELHFSIAHLQWYRSDPYDYISRMNGVDPDLAAHFTIIRHRGKRLCGKEINEVFGDVQKEYYFDSIWNDIENAQDEIVDNPCYFILNLCRVLAYQKDGIILSKREGGIWGRNHIPEKYHCLVSQALDEYGSDRSAEWDESCAREYAAYMIAEIRSAADA